MAFSKQFRNTAYKLAYHLICTGQNQQLCTAISNAVYKTPWKYPLIDKKSFPELFLFEPEVHNVKEWFDWKQTELRLTILAFCIEMTDP